MRGLKRPEEIGILHFLLLYITKNKAWLGGLVTTFSTFDLATVAF